MTDSAYELVRGKIASGELPPHGRIKEQDIAAEMGISRTPVREALARLAAEGLVVTIPRRGAVVCRVELDEIDEIYQIRAALERLVAKRACERATEAEIDEMDEELRVAEQELRASNLRVAGKHTLRFHFLLNRSSRSPHLATMLRSLDERLGAFRNRSMHQPGRAEGAMRQHRAILEALRRRDLVEMQGWIEEHAERGRVSAIAAELEIARTRRMEPGARF